MRAIKIDSESRTVSVIELGDEDSLKDMQTVVGGLIEIAFEFSNNDTVFVNEEGLGGNPQNFFEIDGAHQPFAGDGVVVGHNPKSGDSKDVESSLADIKSRVKFVGLAELKRRYK